MEEATNETDINNMKTLTSRRELLKGSMKRTMAFAKNPPENITADQITTRLSRLEEVWKEYSQCTEALCGFKGEKDFVNPEDEYYECEDMYLDIQCMLQALIPKQTNNDAVVEKQSELINQLVERLKNLESSAGNSQKEDDLPKIVIEPFSGSYKEWPTFEGLFKSALELKPDWTSSQKLLYLRKLLCGDAANLIKQYVTSKEFQAISNDESFDIAWKRLKAQYDRPLYIVNSYIETFMNLPTMKNVNGRQLREISNKASEVINGLDAMGQNERDHWLIYILNSKLDKQTQQKWLAEQSRANPKPTITVFLNFLNQRSQTCTNNNVDEDYYAIQSSPHKNPFSSSGAVPKNNSNQSQPSRALVSQPSPVPNLQSSGYKRQTQHKGHKNGNQRYHQKFKNYNAFTTTAIGAVQSNNSNPNNFTCVSTNSLLQSTSTQHSQALNSQQLYRRQVATSTMIPSPQLNSAQTEAIMQFIRNYEGNPKSILGSFVPTQSPLAVVNQSHDHKQQAPTTKEEYSIVPL